MCVGWKIEKWKIVRENLVPTFFTTDFMHLIEWNKQEEIYSKWNKNWTIDENQWFMRKRLKLFDS